MLYKNNTQRVDIGKRDCLHQASLDGKTTNMSVKIFWIFVLIVITASGVWCLIELPNVAWAIKENGEWVFAAKGYRTLAFAYPILLSGGVLGLIAAAIFLEALFELAKETDYERQIDALEQRILSAERERDNALIDAERLVSGREVTARNHEADALALKQKAGLAIREAKQLERNAEQQIATYKKRATNAIRAADRIKNKARISAP